MPKCTPSALLWRWSRPAEVCFGGNTSLLHRYIVNNSEGAAHPVCKGHPFWGHFAGRGGTLIVIRLLHYDRSVEESRRWSRLLLLRRTVGSDLEVLIVLSAASRWEPLNFQISRPGRVSRTTSPAASRDQTGAPQHPHCSEQLWC